MHNKMYCCYLSQLRPNSATFGLSQDLAQIRAGISLHLNKPLLSPLRYGSKYAKTQPAAVTCQYNKCPDVST